MSVRPSLPYQGIARRKLYRDESKQEFMSYMTGFKEDGTCPKIFLMNSIKKHWYSIGIMQEAIKDHYPEYQEIFNKVVLLS